MTYDDVTNLGRNATVTRFLLDSDFAFPSLA